MRRGHWAAGRWTVADDKVPELFIAGESIAEGAVLVAQTIIHEAAHALLHARGDMTGGTSRGHAYHNLRFVAAAEELGLAKPESPDSVIGWSDCPIRPETIEAHRAEIDELADALTGSIVHATRETLLVWANAIGLIMGGFVSVVHWWADVDLEAAFVNAGGKVTKPRTKRVYRKAVTLACECRTIKLPAAEAAELEDIDCHRCGSPLVAQ